MRRVALTVLSVFLAGCAVVAHPVSVQAVPEPRVHRTPWAAPTPAPTAIPTDPPRAVPIRPTALPTPYPPAPTLPPRSPLDYNATTMQVLVNQDRAAAGLPPLAWSSCLGGNAQRVANRIAAAGALNEPPSDLQANLNCGLGAGAAENEGWCSCGINDAYMNIHYMNSADHRANILGPYHWVGTAWAVASNGYGYTVEEFG